MFHFLDLALDILSSDKKSAVLVCEFSIMTIAAYFNIHPSDPIEMKTQISSLKSFIKGYIMWKFYTLISGYFQF
jgi:hypothetical protein